MTVFDSFAAQYDAWYDDKGKLAFEIELRVFRDLLPLLPKPWLEIGVGSGRFAQALGIETGVDPSARLLEMAMSRGVEGYLGVGEDMPFAAGGFGTAFIIVTLCFVARPTEMLEEVHRILEARGKLVIGSMLREGPWGQFYLKKKTEGHRLYKNAHFLSYKELLQMLQQSDFTIDKTVSTLFQEPGEVNEMESPREHYLLDAGFTIVVAKKSS